MTARFETRKPNYHQGAVEDSLTGPAGGRPSLHVDSNQKGNKRSDAYRRKSKTKGITKSNEIINQEQKGLICMPAGSTITEMRTSSVMAKYKRGYNKKLSTSLLFTKIARIQSERLFFQWPWWYRCGGQSAQVQKEGM